MKFTSDNASGVAPEILEAIAEANVGYVGGYGADPWTERATAQLRDVFERDLEVFFVTTGTAANALALSSLTPSWGSILCHRTAHAEEDECGAPEFYSGGAKLVLVDGPDGRIDPAALSEALRDQGARGVHQTQPAALSVTQATEAGTLYADDHLGALVEAARAKGLKIHMDGTRFANACARTNRSPAEMSWRLGVDTLCLGATKCGAMAAEAIICFDDAMAHELAFRRKRGGHLLSKMRFVSAQMAAWLRDDLWLRLAGRANERADRLAAGLRAIPGVTLSHPVEANMMFAVLPTPAHEALQAAGATYYLEPAWQDAAPLGPTVRARLVCSFSTDAADVDRFVEIVRRAA